MNNLKNENPNVGSMFQNEISYDLKTGLQAGKIRSAIIGEVDLTQNAGKVNSQILQGINAYLQSLKSESQPLPPVLLVAGQDDLKQVILAFQDKDIQEHIIVKTDGNVDELLETTSMKVCPVLRNTNNDSETKYKEILKKFINEGHVDRLILSNCIDYKT